MISALLENNRKIVQDYYDKGNFAFCETSNALLVKEGQEVVAFCLFELDKKSIEVKKLSPTDDIWLADFTLRSALHIAAERCAMDARYSDTAPIELFEKLGFILSREQKTLDIDKLFQSCCGCNE